MVTSPNPQDDGGPAFPDPGRAQSAKQRQSLTATGMTLRDYFAAKAMQAEIESSGEITDIAACAHWSYTMADAMIRARTKEQA